MQGNKFVHSVHLPGTLAANQQGSFMFPFAVTLAFVSAGQSNAGAGTLVVGSLADPDAFLLAKPIGVSGTPVIFNHKNWDGSGLPAGHAPGIDRVYVPKNTPITWLLDYDGAGGTAGQNVSILFGLIEG